MKLLFIGNGNNPLLVNLCKWIRRANKDWVIDIVSEKFVEPGAEIHKHCSNVWFVDDRTSLARTRVIKAGFYIIALRRILRKLDGGYDAVHLHYFSANYSFLFGLLRKLAARVVITVYGSEFYRSPLFIKKLQSRVVRHTDKFTFSNSATLKDFSKHFNVPADKLHVCRFGLSVLEDLRDNMQNTSPAQARKELGLDQDAVTICCGYNASPLQHHVEMIDSLLPVLKENGEILLLLPLTYGGSAQYKREVEDHLAKNKIRAKLFTSFMTNEEVATLRLATDIMINVQPTDQLSGSMQEHFYAGNIVIAGEWLPYSVFDEAGVFYIKTKGIEATGKHVRDCIESMSKMKEQAKRNAEKVWALSSWEKCIDNWLNLYHTS
jgi:glycosyltransferase involved in cell wall biosynthesis